MAPSLQSPVKRAGEAGGAEGAGGTQREREEKFILIARVAIARVPIPYSLLILNS